MAALGTDIEIWQVNTETGLVCRREGRAVVYSCCCVSRKGYKVAWTMSQLQDPWEAQKALDSDGLCWCSNSDGFRICVVLFSSLAAQEYGRSKGRQLEISSRPRRGEHDPTTIMVMT